MTSKLCVNAKLSVRVSTPDTYFTFCQKHQNMFFATTQLLNIVIVNWFDKKSWKFLVTDWAETETSIFASSPTKQQLLCSFYYLSWLFSCVLINKFDHIRAFARNAQNWTCMVCTNYSLNSVVNKRINKFRIFRSLSISLSKSPIVSNS